MTVGLTKHYDEYAADLKKIVKSRLCALDIGSNDGSFLKSLSNNGFKICGVEPASKLAKMANKIGLYTINDFFSKKINQKIIKKLGSKPSIISANYVFANIGNLKQILLNIKRLLSQNGVAVIQTGYHPSQFKQNMFDYIYHEHFHYFTVTSMFYLTKACSLKIFNLKKNNFKGGSIRYYITHQNNNHLKPRININEYLANETRPKLSKDNYYKVFFQKINEKKIKLKSYLNKKIKNQTIIGFGASHSTTTLIYHFGLSKYLEYLIDDNISKIGRFSPGLKLQVFNPKSILNKSKNNIVVIILAWQHRQTILNKYQKIFKKNKISIITPLPDFRIYE